MNEHELFRAMNAVDDSILERSETTAVRRKSPPGPRWILLAACLALIAGLTGIAFAAEARLYATAVDFFEENGLSADGLSRADVKAVYRDISTRRFSDDRTAEVIQRSVPGVEIAQEPAPADLAAIWDAGLQTVTPQSGVTCQVDIVEELDEELGFTVFRKCILSRLRDGTTLWTAEFTDFYVEDWAEISDGLVVWGYTPRWSSEQVSPAWIARLDSEGHILWEQQLEHGCHYENISAVLDNGDGTWGVLSRGDAGPVCLSQYSEDGEELSFHSLETQDEAVLNAVRLGDGYLVQLGSYMDRQNARLSRLDREGNLTDNFTYEATDLDYYLTNMMEYSGRVYLSGYAVPAQPDPGSRNEVRDILEYISAEENGKISSEELTPLLQQNYTAVLLLCDPDGGVPETFYSVRGSLGRALAETDGLLRWDVERIDAAYYSPLTSSFSLGGTCKVYRYTFGPDGTLTGQEDTGETAAYRR